MSHRSGQADARGSGTRTARRVRGRRGTRDVPPFGVRLLGGARRLGRCVESAGAWDPRCATALVRLTRGAWGLEPRVDLAARRELAFARAAVRHAPRGA